MYGCKIDEIDSNVKILQGFIIMLIECRAPTVIVAKAGVMVIKIVWIGCLAGIVVLNSKKPTEHIL